MRIPWPTLDLLVRYAFRGTALPEAGGSERLGIPAADEVFGGGPFAADFAGIFRVDVDDLLILSWTKLRDRTRRFEIGNINAVVTVCGSA